MAEVTDVSPVGETGGEQAEGQAEKQPEQQEQEAKPEGEAAAEGVTGETDSAEPASETAGETVGEPVAESNGIEQVDEAFEPGKAASTVDGFRRLVLGVIVEEYEGEIRDGLYHGEATAKFKGGHTYKGQFENGLMHGNGIYTWTDGTTYTGEFVSNCLTGVGEYKWKDNCYYKGQILNGLRHGLGVFHNPALCVTYDGNWQHGLRHGQGRMWYNNEQTSFYLGDWFNGERHGEGVLKYSSGNLYVGQWFNDSKHGYGMMVWLTTHQVYRGDWKQNSPEGYGEYIWGHPTQAPISVTPDYKLHPSVAIMAHNRYVGEFAEGMRHGFGTFIYATGAEYAGQWYQNTKKGVGGFVFENGSTYEGRFNADRMLDTVPPTARVSSKCYLDINDLLPDSRLFDSIPNIGVLQKRNPEVVPELVTKARENQKNAISNTMIRYNSELLDLYRFFSKIDFDVVTPEPNPISASLYAQTPTTYSSFAEEIFRDVVGAAVEGETDETVFIDVPEQEKLNAATGPSRSVSQLGLTASASRAESVLSIRAPNVSSSDLSAAALRLSNYQLVQFIEDCGLISSQMTRADINRILYHRLLNDPEYIAKAKAEDMNELHAACTPILVREMLELFVRLADFHYTHGKEDCSKLTLPDRVKKLFTEHIMPTYESLLTGTYKLPVWRHSCVRSVLTSNVDDLWDLFQSQAQAFQPQVGRYRLPVHDSTISYRTLMKLFKGRKLLDDKFTTQQCVRTLVDPERKIPDEEFFIFDYLSSEIIFEEFCDVLVKVMLAFNQSRIEPEEEAPVEAVEEDEKGCGDNEGDGEKSSEETAEAGEEDSKTPAASASVPSATNSKTPAASASAAATSKTPTAANQPDNPATDEPTNFNLTSNSIESAANLNATSTSLALPPGAKSMSSTLTVGTNASSGVGSTTTSRRAKRGSLRPESGDVQSRKSKAEVKRLMTSQCPQNTLTAEEEEKLHTDMMAFVDIVLSRAEVPEPEKPPEPV